MRLIAEAVSLALTWPALYVCGYVIVKWRREIIKLCRNNRDAMAWIGGGIFIGFLGQFMDNAYWGLSWSADYTGHSAKDALFSNGVYSNIPFRQVAGILSGYCHLRGAIVYINQPLGHLHRNIFISFLFGVIYVWFIG